MLGNGRQNVNRQPVRHRHIGRDELDAAFHQVRDERDVACKPIELGDHDDGARCLGMRKCSRELRPVIALPALDLDVFL